MTLLEKLRKRAENARTYAAMARQEAHLHTIREDRDLWERTALQADEEANAWEDEVRAKEGSG
jgi:hypothetical protein